MTRERSWTRIDYERAYRAMRSQILWEVRLPLAGISNEIIRAADYSYQAYGYEMHGWTSNLRRARFHQIRWRILSREELPF